MGYSERILKRGFWQKGLVDLLNILVTNFNAMLVKLDADAGVTDTDFQRYLITAPTIGLMGASQGKQILRNGAYLGDLVSLMYQLRTNFNLVMDKLANDAGVNGTTVYTALKFTTSQDLIDVPSALVKKLGANQGAMVQFLDDIVANFDSALLALDGDSGVTDSNYATLGFVSDVVEASSSSCSSRSSSSSCSSRSSSSSCSSSSRSSSSSSSSSCRSSSSSSCSSSCSSRSSSSSSSSCRSSSSSCSSRSSSCSSSSSVSSSSCSSRSSSSSSSCSSRSSSSSSNSSSSSCRSSSSSCSSRSSSCSSSSCRSSSSSSSSSQAIS